LTLRSRLPAPVARARADAIAAAALLAAAVAFYYPLVLLGRAVVDYDAFVFFYPQRAYLADVLRDGRLPLWDPYLFMGAPFLANPQTAVLYPLSWLFVLGPVAAGYTVQLVLHVFLAALFMYALARWAFVLRPAAAAVGALAYGFSGFAVGQTGHLNQLSAAAWLPAVLLAYDRAVSTRQPYWVGLGAVALGMQVLAGHPQVVYMTAIALALFALIRAPWTRPGQLTWAAVAGGCVCLLAALVSAAQLMPTLELAPLSIRGGGVRWEDAVAGSLPSYLAVRALLPPFWLDVASTEYLGYVGVVPLTAGLLALLAVRSRIVLFGAALCAVGLFLALGENNGWYRWVFDSVPGYDTFRVPARWLFLWQAGVSVLAALTADWVGGGATIRARQPAVWLRLVLVAAVLTTGLAWQRDYGEPIPLRRTAAIWAALAAAVLAAGALASVRRQRVAQTILVCLTAGELWAAADASPARQAPPALLDAPGVAAAWLHDSGDPSARVLSAARSDYVSQDEGAARAALGPLPEGVVRSLLVAWKWRDTLAPNVPLQYGLRSVDGYDGGVLPLLRFVQISALAVQSPRPDGVLQSRLDPLPSDRVLRLLGVSYLLTNAGAPPPAHMDSVDLGDVRLYRGGAATGAALSVLLFRGGVAADDDAALARLADPAFDPDGDLVLAAGQAAAALTSDRRGVPVQGFARDAEHWRAQVDAPEAGYLLQREAWYPGWRARVDGVEVPVLRADVLFRAVPVPVGPHQVELFFDPSSFRRGVALSLLGVVLVALLLASPWWRWWFRSISIMARRGQPASRPTRAGGQRSANPRRPAPRAE